MSQKNVDVIVAAQSTSSVTSSSSSAQTNVSLTPSSSTVTMPTGLDVDIVMRGSAGPPGPELPFIVFETGVQTISGAKTFISGLTVQNSFLHIKNSEIILDASIIVSGSAGVGGNLDISGDVNSPYLVKQNITYSIVFG